MARVTSIEDGFDRSALRIPFTLYWLDCGHCVGDQRTFEQLKNKTDYRFAVGDEHECEGCAREEALVPGIRDAIASPQFTHARARPAGHDREGRQTYSVTIYHRDPESPSGVRAVAGGPDRVVDPLLRDLRGTGALSPTEGL